MSNPQYLPYEPNWYEEESEEGCDEEWEDYLRWEQICAECDNDGFDTCACCGAWLCVMHSEVGGGFCRDCPTPDWIAEREKSNEPVT